MMIKIALLDDNVDDLDHLSSLLTKYNESHNNMFTVDVFHTGYSFMENMKRGYDIVFFDIDMPVINGLEVAKKLRAEDKNVSIIFVTYLANLAINGYEVNAANFLVKPISYEQLVITLDQIFNKYLNKTRNKISIHVKGGYKSVYLEDLIYVEVNSHDLIFNCINETFTTRGSLKDLEKQIDSNNFEKCNSCYLVNLDFVNSIIDEYVILPNTKLLMSRNKKKDFINAFLQRIE